MQRAWDAKRGYFAQSYIDEEGNEESTLDSAVLIMPLVFFCAAVRYAYASPSSFLSTTPISYVFINVVRGPVLEHSSSGVKNARTRRSNGKCELSMCTELHLRHNLSIPCKIESRVQIWCYEIRWRRWGGRRDFLFVYTLVSIFVAFSSFRNVCLLSFFTLRCVEALTRAGQYDKSMLSRAVTMFEVRIS